LVTVVEALALVVAGVVAGMVSTVVGLASVVSYPALLAIGLPPLSANMTNTVSLLFTGAGAAAGSRPELAGQAARIRRLAVITALGGGVGAALLLITPSQTFERVAPILIGAASLALLVRPRQDPDARRREPSHGRAGTGPGQPSTGPGHPGAGPDRSDAGPDYPGAGPGRRNTVPGGRDGGPDLDHGRSQPDGRNPGHGGPQPDGRNPGHGRPRRFARSPSLLAGVFGVAVYVGYFGAAGGILMLALLAAMVSEPLARTNAVKNILGAVANAVAAAAFAVLGHVDWAAVAPLAAGFIIGGWLGPALVRRIPGRVLRILVAVCGLAVAVTLGVSAYR
jgi:uncharacterized membrane protein YfcA